MVKVRKDSDKKAQLLLEKIPLATVKRGRRGKHFELMQQLLERLGELSKASALKVPLGNYSAKNLRSAVARAASSRQISISSASDAEHLYVWKK